MLALSGAADIAEFIAVARFTVIAAVIRKLTSPTNADIARADDAIITIRRAVRTRDTIWNLTILTDTAITSVIGAGVEIIAVFVNGALGRIDGHGSRDPRRGKSFPRTVAG